MKHIIIRGKKLDPPQALFTCERCGCFFETDEFHIIERYEGGSVISTKEYYLTSCPQCGRDVERLEYEDVIPPENKKRKWRRFRYEENNRYGKTRDFP